MQSNIRYQISQVDNENFSPQNILCLELKITFGGVYTQQYLTLFLIQHSAYNLGILDVNLILCSSKTSHRCHTLNNKHETMYVIVCSEYPNHFFCFCTLAVPYVINKNVDVRLYPSQIVHKITYFHLFEAQFILTCWTLALSFNKSIFLTLCLQFCATDGHLTQYKPFDRIV